MLLGDFVDQFRVVGNCIDVVAYLVFVQADDCDIEPVEIKNQEEKDACKRRLPSGNKVPAVIVDWKKEPGREGKQKSQGDGSANAALFGGKVAGMVGGGVFTFALANGSLIRGV